MLVFAGTCVVMLSVWTAFGGYSWHRVVIDEISGDSIGMCHSDVHGSAAYLVVLFLVVFIPFILTGIMAWKTRDVDEQYSESKWIFVLIIAQLEVSLHFFVVILLLH